MFQSMFVCCGTGHHLAVFLAPVAMIVNCFCVRATIRRHVFKVQVMAEIETWLNQNSVSSADTHSLQREWVQQN